LRFGVSPQFPPLLRNFYSFQTFLEQQRNWARRKDNLMRLMTATLCGSIVFMLAACGNTATERAATGGLGGAVIAGPAGAVVGGTVGAATAN
jgi:osmotically inducible lipoprotein OsmB